MISSSSYVYTTTEVCMQGSQRIYTSHTLCDCLRRRHNSYYGGPSLECTWYKPLCDDNYLVLYYYKVDVNKWLYDPLVRINK